MRADSVCHLVCAAEISGGYPWYLKPELANVNTFPWSNSVTEPQKLLFPALGKVNLHDYVQAQYQKTVDQTPREADGNIDPMKKLLYLIIK